MTYAIENQDTALASVNQSPLAEDYWDAALCRQTHEAADLFFSEELAEISAAKRICAECPVIVTCLEGALLRKEPCGVWGGQLFERGKVQLVKRRRGRPAKNPRPEDVFEENPIPQELLKLIA